MLYTFRCEKCKRLRVSRSTDFTRIKPLIFAKNHTKPIGNNASGKFRGKLLLSLSQRHGRFVIQPRGCVCMPLLPGQGPIGCCSTTCIGTPFFLVGIERQRERRSFSSSTIKNLSNNADLAPLCVRHSTNRKKKYTNIFFLVNYN